MIAAFVLAAAVTSFPGVTVERIVDGDGLIVSLPNQAEVFGERIPVRIKGIDAPEMRAKRKCERRDAELAKDVLEGMLLGKTVDLNFCTREKYFRINCHVRIANRMDAGTFMLEEGLAVPYSGGSKLKWKCLSREQLEAFGE